MAALALVFGLTTAWVLMKSVYCDDAKDCTSASGIMVSCFLPVSAFCVQEKRKQLLANCSHAEAFSGKKIYHNEYCYG